MPKLVGVRERRHQYYYDTLLRTDTSTAASPTVQQDTQLFNGTNLGLLYWTNMKVAGVFASDETFVVLAMRAWFWFIGSGALTMYQLTAHQLYLTLNVGDKPQFQGPSWTFPQGGGIFGFDSATPAMCYGVPTAEAILKFAKPIPIPARQHFHVQCQLFDTGATSVRTTYYNTGTYGMKEVKIFIDGLHTRDVL